MGSSRRWYDYDILLAIESNLEQKNDAFQNIEHAMMQAPKYREIILDRTPSYSRALCRQFDGLAASQVGFEPSTMLQFTIRTWGI